MKFIARIREHFKREAARQEKLNQLFKPGNIVRHRRSGLCYEVAVVDLHFVLLENEEKGSSFVLDLMTPAGTIRTEIADDWEPTVEVIS